MSKFTEGPWLCDEIRYGCLADSKSEYLVHIRNKDIALVSNKDDARLITAALEMYGVLKTLTYPGIGRQRSKNIITLDGECLRDRLSPSMVQYIHELLARIDGEEAEA